MRGSRTVAWAAAWAGAAGVAYLILPAMGSDLAAQVARADFFATHGPVPIDMRWYGGVQQFGYSLLAQPVMALLGVRVTGAVALIAAATVFAALLVRAGVPRPLLGSLVGVVTIAGNLVSGRVTYGLGVAFGLAALLALTWHPTDTRPGGTSPTRAGPPPAARHHRRRRALVPVPAGRGWRWPGAQRCSPPRPVRWPASSSGWSGSRCCSPAATPTGWSSRWPPRCRWARRRCCSATAAG
ncbi:hypothetical protein Jiend_44480 [Micromonospora endophytica]|nr:hypothetical protein Jiend_44480 [Micromonospora endophytica]